MKRRLFVLLAPFMLLLSSCVSNKAFVYFNDVERLNGIDSTTTIPPIRVQPGDVLQVTISTVDKDISQMFNPITVINSGAINSNNAIAQGYLVNENGAIELPMIGKVNVWRKTTSEINEAIKAELNKSIKNAFVSTRLLNFRVSVLGDVAKPGSFTIPNERISLLDALSLAGDLNITALRNDIMLIREVDGRKRYASINLNDSKTLSSPYYYLTNNDVIYVKPGPNRVFSNSRGYQLLPIILSGLSLVTVLLSTLLK